MRDAIIEEVARMLESSYPDNASTNAFCAAIRSMKDGTDGTDGRSPVWIIDQINSEGDDQWTS